MLIFRVIVQLILAMSPVFASDRIDLYGISEQWKRWPASPGVQKVMERKNREELEKCAMEYPGTPKAQRTTFSMLRIRLDDQPDHYLVIPPIVCRDMHGVHAVSYSLIEVTAVGRIRVLLEDAHDALRIEKTRKFGKYDLTMFYSATKCRYRFDGKQYRSNKPDNEFRCL